MSVLDRFISSVNSVLPEMCTVKDLVRAGIFSSAQSACHARKVGDSPPFFKLGKSIKYPKEGVIIWINGKKHETNQDSSFNANNETNAPISLPQRVDNCGRQRISL